MRYHSRQKDVTSLGNILYSNLFAPLFENTRGIFFGQKYNLYKKVTTTTSTN